MIAITGSTVHNVALTSDSQYTGTGAWPSATSGCSSAKCSTHSAQATQLAYAVRRIAPIRATT